MGKIPLLVLFGPTASGKTKLAVEICKAFGGEVITADSMQVYKQMNIGTAKPTHQEMQGIPHHMIDVVEPTQSYSLAQYVQQAKACIRDVASRGKLPVLAGGTVAVVKLIPEREDESSVPTIETITVLNLDSDDFKTVTVTNENGVFKLYSEEEEPEETDDSSSSDTSTPITTPSCRRSFSPSS